MPPQPRRHLVHIPSNHQVYATRQSLRLHQVLPQPEYYILRKIKGKYYKIPVYGYYFPIKISKNK